MKNLRLEGVTKVYDPGKSYQVDALRGIDAEFESGRSYAIMGASGSGKSTLLNILGCLDRPSSGSYLWDGRRIDALPAKALTEMRAKDRLYFAGLRSDRFHFGFGKLPRALHLFRSETAAGKEKRR